MNCTAWNSVCAKAHEEAERAAEYGVRDGERHDERLRPGDL